MKTYNDMKISEINLENKNLEDDLKKVSLKITKLYSERLAGNITTENYQKSYNDLKYKRTSIEDLLEQNKKTIEYFSEEKQDINKLKKVRLGLKHINNKTFDTSDVDQIIDRIDINPEYIRIHFKFADIELKNTRR